MTKDSISDPESVATAYVLARFNQVVLSRRGLRAPHVTCAAAHAGLRFDNDVYVHVLPLDLNDLLSFRRACALFDHFGIADAC